MEAIETYEKNNQVLSIYYDDYPESPREWDNLGTMVCWHRRYNLGDKTDYKTPDHLYCELWDYASDNELRKYILNHCKGKIADYRDLLENYSTLRDMFDYLTRYDAPTYFPENDEFIVLPLYLYDHSGLSINCSGFLCPWDSGQVGYIFCTKKQATKFGLEWDTEKIKGHLKSEVNVYDHYLRGEVYYYTISEGDNIIDSCSGYYSIQDIVNDTGFNG